MKLLIATFVALSAVPAFAGEVVYPTPPAPEHAEIQIFYGYRGFDNYDVKAVSTLERPLSLGYILAGQNTAACYKGNPSTALRLFSQMTRMYNYEARRAIRMIDGRFFFYADGKGAVQILTVDEVGDNFLVFPRMIECDRWSTRRERGY